jgi:hypothetical protein
LGNCIKEVVQKYVLKHKTRDPFKLAELLGIEVQKGTPIIMPGTPRIPPKIVMEKITQKPDRPVDCPRILGPIKFPSIC